MTRRLGVLAALSVVVALEVSIAVAYLGLGTWWHYLLHQLVGWGVGLSTAALVGTVSRWHPPALPSLALGQLLSIVPDLAFRYARMPHEPSMDLWLGHISIHTGPSPVLVALGALLLGGWGHLAVGFGRPRPGAVLAAVGLVLVAGACLLARPLPTALADYPVGPCAGCTGRAP